MLNSEFLSSIGALLGDSLPDFVEAMKAPPTPAMHLNTLRVGAPALDILSEEYGAEMVPWADNCLYVGAGRPGATPWHDLGACYLQEASAMAPAMVLDAQPGERILDLCAAPGGKSFQIACSLRGEGLLVSNEPIPSRAKVLAENLERLGVVNAIAVSAMPWELAEKWPCFFDAVLVDAPCSGEGMFRRDPQAASEWKPSLPEGCARRQRNILEAAVRMLRSGGRLVYSTCTFNKTENEDVIEDLLNDHPELAFEDLSLPGVGPSRRGMLRLWPHLLRGEGHFAAKIRKKEATEAPFSPALRRENGKKNNKAGRKSVPDKTAPELLEKLQTEICRLPDVLQNGTLLRQADYIHMLPSGAPPLDGIRVVKPGLCLLRAGRSHIQPMPALARACCAAKDAPWLAKAIRSMEISQEEYRRMRASGFEKPLLDQSAWILYTIKGLPVCFVKGGQTGTFRPFP